MAKYSSKDVVIEFDNASGSLVDMSQYILTFNGIDIEAMLAESHSFGDSWTESLYAGMRKVGGITLGGYYDDTATSGPHVIFNDVGNTGTSGTTRTFKATWGGAKTTSVETLIQNYKRLPAKGELTKFEVVLMPTGTVTEA